MKSIRVGQEKKSEELSLNDLVKSIWINRNLLLKITLTSFVLGITIALITPTKYHSFSKFLSQKEGSAGLSGQLGGLASLAGIQSSGLSDGSDLPPEIYPEIVQSYPFLIAMLDAPVTPKGFQESISYREYYSKFYQEKGLELVAKYTLGLPGIIKGWFNKKDDNNSVVSLNNGKKIFHVTRLDYGLIQRVSSQISINSKDDSPVNLGFDMPEAIMAAEMAQYAQTLLQQKLIEIKIGRAKTSLDYTRKLYNEKKVTFEEAQRRLAMFNDRNISLSTELAKSEKRSLTSEYDIAFNVYSELSTQLERAKLKVSEDTPIFTVIEPVRVPLERSEPRRIFLTLVITFLGLLLGVVFVMIRALIKEILTQ